MNLPIPVPTPSALLADFASALNQDQRLVRLRFAANAGVQADTFIVESLHAEEQLFTPHKLTVNCVSADANFELKYINGQIVELGILLPTGGERSYSGIVTSSHSLESDGGAARFQIIAESALVLLHKRFNARVFSGLDITQIIGEILTEHQQANPAIQQSYHYRFDLSRNYPSRSRCIQHNETDFDFIHRLLAEEGLSYYHEFGSDDIPSHTTVFFDDPLALPQNPQPSLRFGHSAQGELSPSADTIQQWHGTRSLITTQTALSSYDYKSVNTHHAQTASRINQGDSGSDAQKSLLSYEPQPTYYASDTEELQRYANLRQDARDGQAKHYRAQSRIRDIHLAHWAPIENHPQHDQDPARDREMLITGIKLTARNNLLGGSTNDGDDTPYSNSFTAVRRGIPLNPAYRPKPSVQGLMTGTIVGEAEEEISTDHLGRAKVQLNWQRSADHPHGTAQRDEKSSTWVPYLHSSADANWGSQYPLRVGQVVALGFLDGDIDRMVILGALHSERHLPPTFSDVGSMPGNKTLSGIKSKMYKGAGANELLLDDSTNQLRARLASDHGHSALNLGFGVHPRHDGEATPRGEGFELRTDLSGALRAALGMIITTDTRPKANGNQLDHQELQGNIEVALNILKKLSELSSTHHAETTDFEPQEQLLEHIKHWEDGSNTDKDGDKSKGGKPIVAISGQAGIAISTPQNTSITTGTNLDMVSVQDVSINTGRHCKVRAAQGISHFAHQGGIKHIAAVGDIDLQAHNGDIRISASGYLYLDGIKGIIHNGQVIQLNAQGAGVVFGNNAITSKTTGTHTAHAGQHTVTGPAAPNLTLPNMPSSELKTDEKFVTIGRGGQAREALPYQIAEMGKRSLLASGKTATDGGTDITQDTIIKNLNLKLKEE